MDQPNYHVLLDGRTVGPYDRKTIVGMRIKRMLTGDHQLVAADGTRLTVRELVGGASAGASGRREASARSAGASPVLGTYTGILIQRGWRGRPVPAFKGELEVRVHADLLRLAGRRRRGFGWKDDRVKVPLAATDPDQPAAARVRAAELRPAVPAARALAVAVLGISAVIALVLLVLMSARTY